MASSDPLAKFQWSARAPLINTSTHVLQIQLHHCLPPPISKLSTPDLAESLLEQGQTGPEMLKISEIFLNIFLQLKYSPTQESLQI